MYLPLVALGYFVSPAPAALTACVVPLLSGVVTGMPPFYPPVAVLMAVELSIMSGIIALTYRLRPPNERMAGARTRTRVRKSIVRGDGVFRFLVIDLPAVFVAGVSFLSGWPGVILMLVVIPPLARLARDRRMQKR